jgi:hypothetical protein
VGRDLHVALVDGTRLDDCQLVSFSRRVANAWIVYGCDDVFVAIDPAEMAIGMLIESVTIAAESWHQLAEAGQSDLRSPSSVVQIILRLERAIGLAAPWPLFEAALRVWRARPRGGAPADQDAIRPTGPRKRPRRARSAPR